MAHLAFPGSSEESAHIWQLPKGFPFQSLLCALLTLRLEPSLHTAYSDF